MALSNRWTPVQVRLDAAGREVPLDGHGRARRVAPDPRDRPLDMVLTPRERDMAAIASVHLIGHVRRLNERDTLRGASSALARIA